MKLLAQGCEARVGETLRFAHRSKHQTRATSAKGESLSKIATDIVNDDLDIVMTMKI